jgi:hypothetical protein
MNKYMFLFRGGEAARAGLSPEDMQKYMQKWTAWFKVLGEKELLLGGDPLDPGGKVLKGTKATLSDGPFAEAKDLVGGYALIRAASIDAAVDLRARRRA